MRAYLLAFLFALPGTGQAGDLWRAGGGEIVLEFNTGVLEPLGIAVEPVDALDVTPAPAPLGYMQIRLAGIGDETLRFQAPGLSIEAFSAGRLAYRGGFRLKTEQWTLDLTGFALVPRDDHRFELNLIDGQGTPWFRLDHVHYELVDGGQAIELRHMNLTMLEAMEALIGVAGIAGQIAGVAHARSPVIEAPTDEAVVLGQCVDPAWGTGAENQVTLIAMSDAAQMRCNECNGTDGGPVVFAPNAQLKNEGSTDVPWWHQFNGNHPPYDNDQHPYLIWNLYRVDGDGRLEQIGASGIKHAFFSTNTNCPCPGGQILWTSCEDTYSASNNDSPAYLAPRHEIIPAQGRWGRCHSFFDPQCQGTQTQSSTDGFQNRMQVMESDLDPAVHAGAEFFMEAWYVVRDNQDIFGAMGWRRFEPEWNGANWTVNLTGTFEQGPFIDNWAAPDEGIVTMNTLTQTGDGLIKVAVRAEETEAGIWRYDYAVANFDFMQATTRGTEPDLEVLSNTSIFGVVIPVDEDVTVSEITSARADRTAGQDWTGARRPGAVTWQDPGDTPLDWGLLYRFSFIANAGPVPAVMELQPLLIYRDRFEPEPAPGEAIQVQTLAPGK